MRILFIVNSFPVFSETFVINQIVSVIEKGHDVLIYSINKPELGASHQQIIEYHLLDKTVYKIRLPKKHLRKYGLALLIFVRNFKKPGLIFKLLNPLRLGRNAFNMSYLFLAEPFFRLDNQFDIIHAHFGETGKIASKLRELRVIEGKLICSFHGIDVNKYYFDNNKLFYKSFFFSLDLALVNSLFLKKRLIHLGCNSDKICIHPNPVNTSIFSRKVNSREKKRVDIISVGRISHEKGFDIAIKVMKRLYLEGFRNIYLKIIGSGNLYDEIATLIEKEKLNDFIELIPNLSQQELIAQYSFCDIFLLCSRRTGNSEETQGIVIQEAQSMQLPVVTSDIGGIGEGLINGETGFLCKEGNINEFVEKLKVLIVDDSLRERMGKEGRRFVIEKYSHILSANNLENIYKMVENA